jgi:hypothetical protein
LKLSTQAQLTGLTHEVRNGVHTLTIVLDATKDSFFAPGAYQASTDLLAGVKFDDLVLEVPGCTKHKTSLGMREGKVVISVIITTTDTPTPEEIQRSVWLYGQLLQRYFKISSVVVE